jgi:hypothetical protein
VNSTGAATGSITATNVTVRTGGPWTLMFALLVGHCTAKNITLREIDVQYNMTPGGGDTASSQFCGVCVDATGAPNITLDTVTVHLDNLVYSALGFAQGVYVSTTPILAATSRAAIALRTINSFQRTRSMATVNTLIVPLQIIARGTDYHDITVEDIHIVNRHSAGPASNAKTNTLISLQPSASRLLAVRRVTVEFEHESTALIEEKTNNVVGVLVRGHADIITIADITTNCTAHPSLYTFYPAWLVVSNPQPAVFENSSVTVRRWTDHSPNSSAALVTLSPPTTSSGIGSMEVTNSRCSCGILEIVDATQKGSCGLTCTKIRLALPVQRIAPRPRGC